MKNMHTCSLQYKFEIDLPPGANFFHRGRGMAWLTEYGPEIIQNPPFRNDRISEDWVIVGDVASNRYVLIGAVTARRSLTQLIVHRENSRITRVTVFHPEIGRDGEPEEVVRLEGRDWRELLVQYAELARERAGADAPPARENSTGYCSWYYNYHQVRESEFLEAVTAMAAQRDVFPARFAQIDDGYQSAHGDWLERNALWPTPLAETARLRLRGARPLDWKDNAWPRVFGGTVDGCPAVAVFNYSDSDWEWTAQELGLQGPLKELLHPQGAIGKTLKLGPHDAALIVEC